MIENAVHRKEAAQRAGERKKEGPTTDDADCKGVLIRGIREISGLNRLFMTGTFALRKFFYFWFEKVMPHAKVAKGAKALADGHRPGNRQEWIDGKRCAPPLPPFSILHSAFSEGPHAKGARDAKERLLHS